MMRVDWIIQALVFGFATGVTIAGFFFLINSDAESGDVFAFFGAIGGAAATVGGAVWLTDRSAKREKQEEQSAIRDELTALVSLADAVSANTPKAPPRAGWKPEMNKLVDRARAAHRFFDEVSGHAKTLTFRQRELIWPVRQAVDGLVRFHDDVFSERELEWYDERTWEEQSGWLAETVREALKVFP